MRRVAVLRFVAWLGLAAVPLSAWGQAQTRLIPSISLSERYDTNVFFIQSGKHLQDFVTTIAPQLNVEHSSRLLSVNGRMTVTGELYVENPGLNYAAITTGASVNLDPITAMASKRWKLGVTEYITYTPQPPNFFRPEAGTAGPDNFIRGIQAVRANSLINVVTATTAYEMSKVTSVTGSVMNQYMRFGTAFAPTPGQGFFTTSFTNIAVGPQFKLTPRDVVNVSFNYSTISWSQGSAFSSGFQLEGVTVGWRRSITQKIAANVSGGFTKFSGSGRIQYVGSGSIEYNERNTSVSLTYSRSIFPSFFIQALPLLSQVVSLNASHRFTDRLSVSGSLNYGRNESTPDPILQFISYGAQASVNYQITRTLSLTGGYLHNQINNQFRGQSFSFDRDAVTLTVNAQFPNAFRDWMESR